MPKESHKRIFAFLFIFGILISLYLSFGTGNKYREFIDLKLEDTTLVGISKILMKKCVSTPIAPDPKNHFSLIL